MLLPGPAPAQSHPQPASALHYWALLVDDSSVAYPSSLPLDYGQRAKPETASEKIRRLNAIVAALNYLRARG